MKTLRLIYLSLQFLLIQNVTTTAQISTYVRDSILPYQYVLPNLYPVEYNPLLQNRTPSERKINPDSYVINLRGNLITIEKQPFTLKKLWFSKMFPDFGLHKYDTYKDSSIAMPYQAYFAVEHNDQKSKSVAPLYYFLQLPTDSMVGIKLNGTLYNADFTLKELALFVAQNKVFPDSSVADPLHLSSFLFAGREIPVDPTACKWTAPACIQCPDYGEVSWSLFPTMEEAQANMNLQLEKNKAIKNATIVSETDVPVIFEGVSVNARKLILKYKGIIGAKAKMEGSNLLTAYYVVAFVRGRWINCLLSHWGNDWVEEGKKLPPLLEAVMQLK